MRVDVACNPDFRMTQDLLSKFQVPGLGVQNRADAMPKQVETMLAFDAGNAGPVQRLCQHSDPQLVRALRRTIGPGKYEVVGASPPRVGSLLFEPVGELAGNSDSSPARFGLGLQ